MAEFADIETAENTSFSDEFTLTDENGVAIDLSGCTAVCHARLGSPDQPGAIALTVSTANGKLAIDALAGTVTRTLAAADLARATFPASDYWYELVVTFPSGVVERPAVGHWQHRVSGVDQP